MRGVTLVLSLGLAVSGLTGGPSVAAAEPPGDRPLLELAPVPGTDVRSLDVPLPTSAGPGSPRSSSGPLRTTPFSMVGLTWRGAVGPRVLVRTRTEGGWTRWRSVPVLTDLPDARDEGRSGLRATQPWWVGPSDGVDVRVTGRVKDLVLALIDPGPTPPSATAAGRTTHPAQLNKPHKHKPKAAPRPRIKSRDAWGANEKWRNGGPWFNRTIKQVHVHHTATGNDYRRRDVPALLRGIYRYHTHNLGWSDIGYNFVVDRFGRIWQGRAGGIGRPVRGAHTLGFNHASAGVAVLGTFTEDAPRSEVLTAIVRLAAWRLDHYDRRPAGRVKVRSEGSDKFAAGEKVRLPVIDGHRDTNDTECPGQLLYDKLPSIRKRAQARADRYDPPRHHHH
jgi:hypothetical protein